MKLKNEAGKLLKNKMRKFFAAAFFRKIIKIKKIFFSYFFIFPKIDLDVKHLFFNIDNIHKISYNNYRKSKKEKLKNEHN